MTEEHPRAEGEDVLTLQDLISVRRRERGWSYPDLAARSNYQLTRQRWQQLGAGTRATEFPEVKNIRVIAEALEVNVTTVVLAAAKSAGLSVSLRGPDLAQLLPAGTDLLSEQMRDAILAVIRSAVTDSIARGDDITDSISDVARYEPHAIPGPPDPGAGRNGEPKGQQQ